MLKHIIACNSCHKEEDQHAPCPTPPPELANLPYSPENQQKMAQWFKENHPRTTWITVNLNTDHLHFCSIACLRAGTERIIPDAIKRASEAPQYGALIPHY